MRTDWVVLEIGASPGEVDSDGDLGFFQQRGWTNAAQLQNLGSVDGTGRENDLFACLDRGKDPALALRWDKLNPRGLIFSIKQDLIHSGPGDDVVVLSLQVVPVPSSRVRSSVSCRIDRDRVVEYSRASGMSVPNDL